MPKAATQSKYILGADIIRAAAILGVIVMHVDDITPSAALYLGGMSWWLSNLLNSFSRASVPLFIMLSGYLLLDRAPNKPYSQLLNRTWARILLPLLAWSVIYGLWQNLVLHQSQTLTQLLWVFFNRGYEHLYFLWIMVGLYLTLPLWQQLVTTFKHRSLLIATGAWLGLNSLNLYLSFMFLNQTNEPHALNLFLLYVPYFLLGGLLKKLKFKPTQLKLALGTYIIASLLIAGGTYLGLKLMLQGNYLLVKAGLDNIFHSHFNLFTIAQSLSLFIFLINIKRVGKWLQLLIQQLAQNSLAIYLVHILILFEVTKVFKLELHLISAHLWLYFLEKVTLTLIFSYLAALLLRKLPVVKRIVGEKG